MRSNQVVPPPASGAPAAVRAELMSHASHTAVLDKRAHVCAAWQRLQVPAWRAFFAGVGDLQTWVPVTKEQVCEGRCWGSTGLAWILMDMHRALLICA